MSSITRVRPGWKNCPLGFAPSRQRPFPPMFPNSTLRKVLRPLLQAWPDEGRQIVQGPLLRELISRAAKSKRSFRRVLNAGAGEGGYSLYLAGLPELETLLDYDLSYSSHTFARLHAKQVRVAGSLTDIPLADCTVDFILCSEVLEHIPAHGQALDELNRVLVPGGCLLITVPTPPAVPDKNHVREGYRHEELDRLLAERGLEVLDNRFCMHFFFRSILANWPHWPWRIRFFLRGLSALDTILHLGPPMDLMILARKPVMVSNQVPNTGPKQQPLEARVDQSLGDGVVNLSRL
ncbi:MAG: hypothetical protein C5B51_16640 [Terriglobia bacterium]|nr:MAG: hypothetical protein C5B51_16640 [Terriglobia bacterium]